MPSEKAFENQFGQIIASETWYSIKLGTKFEIYGESSPAIKIIEGGGRVYFRGAIVVKSKETIKNTDTILSVVANTFFPHEVRYIGGIESEKYHPIIEVSLLGEMNILKGELAEGTIIGLDSLNYPL